MGKNTIRVLRTAALVVTVALCAFPTASIQVAAAASNPPHSADPVTQLDHVEVSYGTVKPAVSKEITAPPPLHLGRTTLRAASIRCWTLDVTRKGKNIFGGTLITFKTHTSWCGDGSWIRSRARTTSSHSQAFGWSYNGLVQNYNQYGINWNQFHSMRQAQFCLLNCVAQSKYLTDDIRVGPNGQVYHT